MSTFAFPDGYDPLISSIERVGQIHEAVVNNGVMHFLRHDLDPVTTWFGLAQDKELPPEWSHPDTDTVRHGLAARWNAIDKIHRLLDGQHAGADQLGEICNVLEECGLKVRGADEADGPPEDVEGQLRWVEQHFKKALRPLIGEGRITKEFIDREVRPAALSVMERLRERMPAREFVSEVKVDPDRPGEAVIRIRSTDALVVQEIVDTTLGYTNARFKGPDGSCWEIEYRTDERDEVLAALQLHAGLFVKGSGPRVSGFLSDLLKCDLELQVADAAIWPEDSLEGQIQPGDVKRTVTLGATQPLGDLQALAQDMVEDLKVGSVRRKAIIRALRGFGAEQVDLTPRPQVQVIEEDGSVRVRWVVHEYREVTVEL